MLRHGDYIGDYIIEKERVVTCSFNFFMYNIRKEQSSMLWCNFMKQFSNMEFWIDDFKEKLLQSFGDRIICFGLQGSYGRGEQTSTSDIDVVVILDRVSFPICKPIARF